MVVDDTDVVDLIGTERDGSGVVLVVSDHLDWSDPDRHLELLQEKINTYVSFVESGEMLDAYPHAIGRSPVIKVVGVVPLPDVARDFFERARTVLAAAGIELRFESLP